MHYDRLTVTVIGCWLICACAAAQIAPRQDVGSNYGAGARKLTSPWRGQIKITEYWQDGPRSEWPAPTVVKEVELWCDRFRVRALHTDIEQPELTGWPVVTGYALFCTDGESYWALNLHDYEGALGQGIGPAEELKGLFFDPTRMTLRKDHKGPTSPDAIVLGADGDNADVSIVELSEPGGYRKRWWVTNDGFPRVHRMTYLDPVDRPVNDLHVVWRRLKLEGDREVDLPWVTEEWVFVYEDDKPNVRSIRIKEIEVFELLDNVDDRWFRIDFPPGIPVLDGHLGTAYVTGYEPESPGAIRAAPTLEASGSHTADRSSSISDTVLGSVRRDGIAGTGTLIFLLALAWIGARTLRSRRA